MSDVEVTRAELIRRIEEGRRHLDQMLSTLTDEQLTTPGGPDGWSVKDHLAHLAAWETGQAAMLRRENRWVAMGYGETEPTDTDEINAVIYKLNKNRSLPEVRAALDDAHQQLIRAINNLSEADLFKTYSYYQPQEPGEDDGQPIWPRIVGNSFGHYEEHEPWIKEVLAGNSGR